MAGPDIRSFVGRVQVAAHGRSSIRLDFDPAEAWGRRDRYHVTGSIDGVGFRTQLANRQGSWWIALGPKSPSACRVVDGQSVAVAVWPEGPQRGELAPDIARALADRPQAQAAFEALATFYRKGWLRWIDATKRHPEVRAERIREMTELLEGGHKERPRSASS